MDSPAIPDHAGRRGRVGGDRGRRCLRRGAKPILILAGRPLVRYPEKTDLILLTSRPAQLETPMRYFEQALTPNDAFFVRYHIFRPATAIWRPGGSSPGRVDRPLDLHGGPPHQVSERRVIAVNQCSGNSRGRFTPRVLGGQWGDGAMGNAEWVGVRLQDILRGRRRAAGRVQVTFDGLDQPAVPDRARFRQEPRPPRIMEDPDILVAYQMNGAGRCRC